MPVMGPEKVNVGRNALGWCIMASTACMHSNILQKRMYMQAAQCNIAAAPVTHLTLTLIFTPIAILQTDEVLPAQPICQASCQLHLHRQMQLTVLHHLPMHEIVA